MSKSQSVAYTAMSIVPTDNGSFIIVELGIDKNDKVVSVTRSEPKPFFMAVHDQKRRAAELWVPVV